LRALAVSTGKRSPLAPDLLTVAESSVAHDFNVTNWLGLLAPADTPPAIVNRTSAEFSELMAKEVARYRDLIKSIGCTIPACPSKQGTTWPRKV